MEDENLSQMPQDASDDMPNEIAQAEVEVEDTQKKKKIIGAGIVVLIIIILVGAFLWQSKQGGERVREVAVAVSVPLRLSLGRDIMNSITLAFEEAGYKAGDVKVNLIPFDGGDESGAWQEDLEVKNAEQAAANGSVVAYIGTYNSGAAKISMPILNRAGIVQVSPGNTWPGLTKEGFLPGEPGRFYPTGLRHYVRVVTTDDLQGPAGAIWAKELGFNSVYILDDGESYGKGVADLFRTRAQDIGLTVLKQVTIDKKGTDFTHEILDIKQLNPDLIYYGGITPNGITHLLSQARNAGVESAFMGPDGILESDFILRTGVENAEGVYATTVGVLPIDIGTPESAVYYAAYMERFGEEPGVFGAFGYEAAQVVLAGIENAEIKDRAGVLQEIKRTADFEGLFEKWSFDENGDTSLKLMSGNIVHDGKYEYVETLLVP